ncbi:hypothetical protein I2484_20455 [Sporosarcina sp. E16_8]|nr:hypothetical protein [Sporosarcina sp. E16_8]
MVGNPAAFVGHFDSLVGHFPVCWTLHRFGWKPHHVCWTLHGIGWTLRRFCWTLPGLVGDFTTFVGHYAGLVGHSTTFVGHSNTPKSDPFSKRGRWISYLYNKYFSRT